MIEQQLVLKISGNEWRNFSRDKRELSLYRELGSEVRVMAKGDPHDKGRREEVESFQVYRYSTRPLGQCIPIFLNRFVSLFTWAYYARKQKADIISGHDVTGLLIGWLSTLLMKRKHRPKLIYDAHEFEIGRTAKRNLLQVWLITRLEGFLMRRSELSMMVNDTIADEVQRIHKLETRPIVIRNVPNYWKLDEGAIADNRAMIIERLKVNPDTLLLSHHGSIEPGRGIETLIHVISRMKGVCAVIMGDGTPAYLSQLHILIERLDVKHRVLFLPAVSIEDLPNYVGAFDISCILVKAINKNHFWSLPNKFFESIQALTPIIASDYPEIGRLIKENGIGVTVDPDNVNQIILAVEKIKSDMNFNMDLKNNLAKAKETLCWENEKKILADAFLKL